MNRQRQRRAAILGNREVETLRQEFRQRGLEIPPVEIENSFGGSRSALQKFQKMVGLKTTGRVNRQTARMIASMVKDYPGW